MSTELHERPVSDGGTPPDARWVLGLERLIFGHRRAVLAIFLLASAFMVWSLAASNTTVSST